MSYTIGDGLVTFALAAGVVGYFHVRNLARQKKMDIIHQERMAAMEKGIPLPEFPLEAVRERGEPDPRVLPILGTVLLSVSVGAMIVLDLVLPASTHAFWISPLPIAFLGVGLVACHFLKVGSER